MISCCRSQNRQSVCTVINCILLFERNWDSPLFSLENIKMLSRSQSNAEWFCLLSQAREHLPFHNSLHSCMIWLYIHRKLNNTLLNLSMAILQKSKFIASHVLFKNYPLISVFVFKLSILTAWNCVWMPSDDGFICKTTYISTLKFLQVQTPNEFNIFFCSSTNRFSRFVTCYKASVFYSVRVRRN